MLSLKIKKLLWKELLNLKLMKESKDASKKIDKQIAKAKALSFNKLKINKLKKKRKIFDADLELKSDLKKLSPFNEKFDKKAHTNLSTLKSLSREKNIFQLLLNKTVTLKQLNMKKNEAQDYLGNLSIKTPLSKLKVANLGSTKLNLKQRLNRLGFVERTVEIENGI